MDDPTVSLESRVGVRVYAVGAGLALPWASYRIAAGVRARPIGLPLRMAIVSTAGIGAAIHMYCWHFFFRKTPKFLEKFETKQRMIMRAVMAMSISLPVLYLCPYSIAPALFGSAIAGRGLPMM